MNDDQLSTVFSALADPTRRAILQRLADGDASVAELAAPHRMSQPAISRHLKVLEQAGLISRSRRATTRLSHLRAAPMREAADWLASYRQFWDESFDRLDELLADLQADSPGVGGPAPGEPAVPPPTDARTDQPPNGTTP